MFDKKWGKGSEAARSHILHLFLILFLFFYYILRFPLEIFHKNRYNNLRCLGVAQFGSAREWGSRGRRFESSHSDHFFYSKSEIYIK